jgi:hypothetical protein
MVCAPPDLSAALSFVSVPAALVVIAPPAVVVEPDRLISPDVCLSGL